MGMFDNIIVKYPLPNTVPDWVNENTIWQTKDTDSQSLDTYVITKEGKLIHQTVKYESVPEEKRPYWGTPEWETGSFAKFCGSMKSVSTGDIDVEYHGDMHISAMTEHQPYKFCNCTVRFNNGRVQYINFS